MMPSFVPTLLLALAGSALGFNGYTQHRRIVPTSTRRWTATRSSPRVSRAATVSVGCGSGWVGEWV